MPSLSAKTVATYIRLPGMHRGYNPRASNPLHAGAQPLRACHPADRATMMVRPAGCSWHPEPQV